MRAMEFQSTLRIVFLSMCLTVFSFKTWMDVLFLNFRMSVYLIKLFLVSQVFFGLPGARFNNMNWVVLCCSILLYPNFKSIFHKETPLKKWKKNCDNATYYESEPRPFPVLFGGMDNFRRGLHSFFVTVPKIYQLY